ncbi:MAG: amino acid adenylation domain-containing protein [Gemmataceae bacterium]|nr:amino acid adenylation domain-containing protein [Gemmataceae bacterium]
MTAPTAEQACPRPTGQNNNPVVSARLEAEYPLSPLQQGLLFHALAATEHGVYIQQMVCELDEALDVFAFRRAWDAVAARHPILRSALRWEGLAEPLQIVADRVEIPVAEEDWRDVPADEQKARLGTLLETDRRRGFDLGQAPLMRLTLVRRADARWTCVWTYHHILLDGRSHTIVLKEAFALYEAYRQGRDEGALPAPPRPYRDYIAWLGQQDWTEARAYWKEALKGFRAPTPLPAVAPAPGTVFPAAPHHGMRTCRLSAELTAALQNFAQQHDLTLNTLVQGAFAALLSRYSGEEEVVFGATRACRYFPLDGAQAMVGLFINTLPVRGRVGADATVLPFLRDLRTQSLAVRPHEHTPLLEVQEASEVPRGRTLFDSIFVFESYTLTDSLRAQGGAWLNREFKLLEETNYPLALCVYAGAGLLLKALFHRPRFDDGTIDRMFGHLQTLLEGMIAHPDERVAALPILTAVEHRQIVHEWNATAADYPRDRCIHQLFEAQARRTPDAVAVVHEGRETTYRELNERANRLAHHLRGLGVGPGVLVGICIERSTDMIVGVLGITKAGGAYVPLDPAYPKDRLAFMLEDTAAPILLTQQKFVERLPQSKAKLLCLDTLGDALAQESAADPASGVTPDDRAYIIYTSGSTGQPKGVVLRHGPVVNLLDWVNTTYHVGPGDRVLFVTSLNFDLSVYDLFGILGAGATVRVASSADLRDPERLVQILCTEPITFWDSAPPHLQQLAAFFPTARPQPGKKGLRLVFLSGDWIPVPLPDAVRGLFPGAQVVSLGGATEAAIWSNSYPIGVVDPKWPSIPYGKPIRNARYHVLDKHLNPVPVGIPAELHIGGGCLADGYLNRPELTAEKFIPDPFAAPAPPYPPLSPGGRGETGQRGEGVPRLYKTGDLARYFPDGNLEFLGRIDFQVKIRGFRIELGEIEAVLAQHPAVREGLVTALKGESGDRYLCAYYIPKAGQEPAAADLRQFLEERLPAHMVPPHYVALGAFPLSPNGKIDRKALPAPDQAAGGQARTVVGPRDDAELDLVGIWEDILKVKPIGMTDNFFDLGGNSFLAALLVARIRQQLGHNVPLGALLAAPTIEQLATVLKERLEAGSESSIVPLREEGANPPLYMIAGVGGHVFTFHKFARLLGADQPVYGVKAIGVDGATEPPETVEEMAAHYVREITAQRPQGPYLVSGYSIGAIIALELALQLRDLGHRVDAVVVFDVFAPGYPRKLPLMRRLWMHTRTFFGLPLKEKTSYLGERLDKVKVRVLNWVGQGIRNAPSLEVEGLSEDALKRVWLALQLATQRYRPKKAFDGKVVLFKTEEKWDWPATIHDDPLYGWGQCASGGVESHSVPGGHMEVFHDEHIHQVARDLTRSIATLKGPA